MVSFSCENCGDVLVKKKLDQHAGRCRGASFSCLDCMEHFVGVDYRSHTSCITEEQKYHGPTLYQSSKKIKFSQPQTDAQLAALSVTKPIAQSDPQHVMSQRAYVEEIADEEYRSYGDDYDDNSPAEPLPEAPTPPASYGGPINVFDFLLPVDPTPDPSVVNVGRNEETQLVHLDEDSAAATTNANAYIDPGGYMVDDDNDGVIHHSTGPIDMAAAAALATPTVAKKPTAKVKAKSQPKANNETKAVEPKKDKKRKRLHVEINDQVMTEAPPVLHSGLTGDLNRMMRPQFPPSPEYSGDGAEPSPASPVKKTKTKHSKNRSSRSDSISSSLFALVSGRSSKTKKSKASKKRPTPHHRHRHSSDSKDKPSQKLIEFRPPSSEGANANNQMILYRPRADLFLSMVNKGPESDRGCSVNKALKRFHRVRTETGEALAKNTEEKELWRSLRMRRNDRGEIVLFSLEDEG